MPTIKFCRIGKSDLHNSITTIPKLRQIYEDVYKNAKAVISSTKIFTRNNKDMYVPVEYYGIPKK